jgi:hypothetical protein
VHPKGKELLNPGIDLCIHQLSGEKAVGAARPGIRPRCHLPPLARLDVADNEGTEDVRTQQLIPEQAFEDVKHRPPLVDVLLSDSVPPVGLSSRAPTRNHRERCVDVILQEEPLHLPPTQRVGHRELEVRVDLKPSSDMNIDAAPHRCLRARVLPESDMTEIVPQIKVGLNPHVSLAQGYEGRDVQNPQRSQMMQLQAIELQQQVEESMRRHTKSSLIERRARYDISCRRGGGLKIYRNMTGS